MNTKFLSTILIGYFAMACGGAEGGTQPSTGATNGNRTNRTASTDQVADAGAVSDEPADEGDESVDEESAPVAQDDEPMQEDVPAAQDEEPQTDEVNDEDEESDTTAPTVISTFPEHEATGVLAEDVIVIEFSEPMDQEATEAAYVSLELPANEVAFSWNEEATQLTITPNDDLDYAAGWIPEDVTANHFQYALAGAKDVAGNLLENTQVGFDTARLILAQAPLIELASGTIQMTSGATVATIGAGDTSTGAAYRGYASFELPPLPEDRLDLLVQFQTQQSYVNGAPFTNLVTEDRGLCLMAASFSNAEDVQLSELSEPLGDLSTDPELGGRLVDVTEMVEALYQNEASWAQFIIEFATPTDGVGDGDVVHFDNAQTWLAIGYLIH
jgi:hypothetical protein